MAFELDARGALFSAPAGNLANLKPVDEQKVRWVDIGDSVKAELATGIKGSLSANAIADDRLPVDERKVKGNSDLPIDTVKAAIASGMAGSPAVVAIPDIKPPMPPIKYDRKHILARLKNANAFVSVHWSADPVLGIPVAPYDVEQCLVPMAQMEAKGDQINELLLDPANGQFGNFAARLQDFAAGFFYVRAIVAKAEPGASLYARNINGEELMGSRIAVQVGDPVILFGPSLCSIASSAKVVLTQVRLGRLPTDMRKVELLARVAPSMGNLPGPYDNQEIFGLTRDANAALDDRLYLDALARSLIAPPADATLASKVHHFDRYKIASELLQTSYVDSFRNDFAQMLNNPTLGFNEQLDIGNQQQITATQNYAAILQFLGAIGPIDAAVVGAGIALPLLVPDIRRVWGEMEEGLRGERLFPFPIIRVTGYFRGKVDLSPRQPAAEIRRLAKGISSFVRLTYKGAVPALSVTATPAVAPLGRNLHAQCRAKLSLSGANPTDGYFLVRNGPSQVKGIIADSITNRPKQFMASPDYNSSGASNLCLSDGLLNLPFVSPENCAYQMFPRDEFGRWLGRSDGSVLLNLWKSYAPTLIGWQRAKGVTDPLALLLDWSIDWTKRSHDRVEFAMMGMGPVQIVVRFTNADPQLPFVAQISGGSGFTASIVHLPPTPPDGASGPAGSTFNRTGFDEYSYRLTVMLPSNNLLFAPSAEIDFDAHAFGFEAVNPSRSSQMSNKIKGQIIDPRPPQLAPVPFVLKWASLSDAARLSAIGLTPPAGNANQIGYFDLWRTSEASVVNWIKELLPVDGFGIQLKQTTDSIARFELLRDRLLSIFNDQPGLKSDFANLFEFEGRIDPGSNLTLQLPGRQSGLELVFFSAVSKHGVSSDKSMLYALTAVAVPQRRQQPRPILSVMTSDVRQDKSNPLAKDGLGLFVVSSMENISGSQIAFYADEESAVRTSDDLLYEVNGARELTVDDVEQLVSSRANDLSPLPDMNNRYFTVPLVRSWNSLLYCAAVVGDSSNPEKTIPSARSPFRKIARPPTVGPTITATGPSQVWVDGLCSYDGPFGASQLIFSVVTSSGSIVERHEIKLTLNPVIPTVTNANFSLVWQGKTVFVSAQARRRQHRIQIIGVDPVNRSVLHYLDQDRSGPVLIGEIPNAL
jgi:hypothetical protein